MISVFPQNKITTSPRFYHVGSYIAMFYHFDSNISCESTNELMINFATHLSTRFLCYLNEF